MQAKENDSQNEHLQVEVTDQLYLLNFEESNKHIVNEKDWQEIFILNGVHYSTGINIPKQNMRDDDTGTCSQEVGEIPDIGEVP